MKKEVNKKEKVPVNYYKEALSIYQKQKETITDEEMVEFEFVNRWGASFMFEEWMLWMPLLRENVKALVLFSVVFTRSGPTRNEKFCYGINESEFDTFRKVFCYSKKELNDSLDLLIENKIFGRFDRPDRGGYEYFIDMKYVQDEVISKVLEQRAKKIVKKYHNRIKKQKDKKKVS
ncbi:hypothetical protein LNO75_00390 [Mycoplasma sp. T363T]|uniref:hypothetical protein n=1 Tax=Mycoplasma bradburyae TaxID=2963128 RepID=UPI0023413EC4|nr:hypothetical protein [Mycoplasma bradburyae]MDC4163039.1 hypothetical protein [Mycoplasma bradburyae]